jgi:GH25 family lysozyme M1 (1,4-beta-N-acetylmuramidase)
MSLWGVDISNHQPGADLAKAKAAGCSFVFAKATEGATYADPYFAGFRTKAAQLGLPLGAYHFARPQPGRTGAQEAGAFLHVVGTVRGRRAAMRARPGGHQDRAASHRRLGA